MKNYLIIAFLLLTTTLFAQKKAPDFWQTLDPKTDNVYGVGSEEAYKTLGTKTSKTVIVAVIDCGVDFNHEDLKSVIWTNPGEIPDNGIDDDHNGYVDDIHGWSFLGGKNGDIGDDVTELVRLVKKGDKKYATADESTMSVAEAKEYAEYKKMKAAFRETQQKQEKQIQSMDRSISLFDKVRKQNNGDLTIDGLKKYVPENDNEKKIVKNLLAYKGMKLEDMEKGYKRGKARVEKEIARNMVNTDSIRQAIVGDDLNNPNERFYGNNHIQGPDASHGTHVSGIIAAVRDNNLGIKGIADNVKIMVIRAVPDNGDERDKDVANAIRYAADNGATVVNMSFGKDYTTDKNVIDEAVKYAESKDVLLIQAAGNDSRNDDIKLPFPNREYLSEGEASNWIMVGANAYLDNKKIIGSFSNYGKKKVDLFAPGVGVYSCLPDNKYANMSGTSMASPSTAGVAAMIREYFPALKAPEVREILMKTVIRTDDKVNVPGLTRKKLFSKKTKPVTRKVAYLCISGGFVNADNAVKELMLLNVSSIYFRKALADLDLRFGIVLLVF